MSYDYSNAWNSVPQSPEGIKESMREGVNLMSESIFGLMAAGKLTLWEAQNAIDLLDDIQDRTASLLAPAAYAEAWEDYLDNQECY